MSPELINPGTFGLKVCRPAKESDCYAVGMVMYEVLSGRTPFAQCNTIAVISKVLNGERPGRPQGEEGTPLTDEIWGMLERCWKPRPYDRITAKDILLGFEGTSSPLWPPSNVDGDMGLDIHDWFDATVTEPGMFSLFNSRLAVNPPCGATGPMVAHGNDGPPVPPHGHPNQHRWIGGWAGDWLIHAATKVFNIGTKPLHALWQAKQ